MSCSSLNQSSPSSIRWKSSRSSGCSVGPTRGSVELGRQAPDLHADARRHEQVDDALARALRDRRRAQVGHRKRVRTLTRRRSRRARRGRWLAAARRRRSDSWHGWWSREGPFRTPGSQPSAGPRRALEVESTRLGRTDHHRRRGDHVRPSRSARQSVRRTHSRRSTRALELGASGLESDAWLSPTARSCSCTTRAFRRGLRKVRVAATTAAELAEFDVPRLADLYATCGTDYELSIDAKEPAVIAAMADVACAARRARAAVDLLTRLRRAARARGSRSPTSGSSTPPATAGCRRPTSSATAPTSRPPASTR